MLRRTTLLKIISQSLLLAFIAQVPDGQEEWEHGKLQFWSGELINRGKDWKQTALLLLSLPSPGYEHLESINDILLASALIPSPSAMSRALQEGGGGGKGKGGGEEQKRSCSGKLLRIQKYTEAAKHPRRGCQRKTTVTIFPNPGVVCCLSTSFREQVEGDTKGRRKSMNIFGHTSGWNTQTHQTKTKPRNNAEWKEEK